MTITQIGKKAINSFSLYGVKEGTKNTFQGSLSRDVIVSHASDKKLDCMLKHTQVIIFYFASGSKIRYIEEEDIC